MSKYIIGDTHGCFDTFMALVKKLPKDAEIVLCGDLIDRGPKSREVVQYVIDNNIPCVRGNHEQMMIDEYQRVVNFIDKTGLLPRGNAGSVWTVNGGYETLQSYELVLEDELDDRGLPTRVVDIETLEEHRDFMDTLPIYLEYPELKNEDGRHLVVSHSVLHTVWKHRNNTEPHMINQFNNTAMWSRAFHNLKDNPEIYNVIGHTPQEGGAHVKKIYANVDTGCVFRSVGYETLTALKFPEMEIITQENIDEVTW